MKCAGWGAWMWMALSGMVFAAPQAVRDWQGDEVKSRVQFVIRQMNVPVEGHFSRFKAQARVEPARLEQGQFSVELDVASISTGSAEGDAEVQRPVWFDAARFPKVFFVSQRVRKMTDGRYAATGLLSVKGQQRPIEILFGTRAVGPTAWQAEGHFVLRRSDFGIGGGEWNDVVADEAEVRFMVVFKR